MMHLPAVASDFICAYFTIAPENKILKNIKHNITWSHYMEFYCYVIELPIFNITRSRQRKPSIVQNIKKLEIEDLAQQTKKNMVEYHQVSAPLFSLTGDSVGHSTAQFLPLCVATNIGY